MTAPANLRGWGQGWPVNRSSEMEWVRATRSGAKWQVHELIAPIVRFVVNEVERRGYWFDHGPDDVDDEWGYNNRPIRGKKVSSNHSWGLAIDIDAQEYPMGVRRNPPQWIIDLFDAYGFDHGGAWRRPDGMHFEFRGWPRDAREITAMLAASHLGHGPAAVPVSVPPPPVEEDPMRLVYHHNKVWWLYYEGTPFRVKVNDRPTTEANKAKIKVLREDLGIPFEDLSGNPIASQLRLDITVDAKA